MMSNKQPAQDRDLEEAVAFGLTEIIIAWFMVLAESISSRPLWVWALLVTLAVVGRVAWTIWKLWQYSKEWHHEHPA